MNNSGRKTFNRMRPVSAISRFRTSPIHSLGNEEAQATAAQDSPSQLVWSRVGLGSLTSDPPGVRDGLPSFWRKDGMGFIAFNKYREGDLWTGAKPTAQAFAAGTVA